MTERVGQVKRQGACEGRLLAKRARARGARICRLIALAAAALGGAQRLAHAGPPPVVGIAMPNIAEARWTTDGASIARELAARGLGADLRNADNDVVQQIAQIEAMIAAGDKVLVIAPVDDAALAGPLADAAARDVAVISYDRLIRDTPYVDYLATFDNFATGVLQARSLLQGLAASGAKPPFTVELFGGSPDDGNADVLYDGAMSVLAPLIKSGMLILRSGQTTLRDIATLRWDSNFAHARMDNLISAYYPARDLEGVLAPNDEVARGVISSLEASGYGQGAARMPVVTGQDCEIDAVKNIIGGKQYSSVFKDTRRLARVAAEIAAAIIGGHSVPVNDHRHYNNGVKDVPAFVLQPVLVDRSDYETLLVSSGYYAMSALR